MNDTTLPIKREKHSNDASTATASTSINTDAAKLIARLELQNLPRKAGARRGFGLHDWNLLLRSSKDLAQRKGQPLRRDIPMQEVQQHASVHDGWTVLYGKVYNLSPYLPYHPGGAGILKQVLGKNGTALFEKYHRWVNIERLIGPLLLGTVDKRSLRRDDDDEDEEDLTALAASYLPTDAAAGLMPPPPPRQRAPVSLLGDKSKTEQLDETSDHSAKGDLNPWEQQL